MDKWLTKASAKIGAGEVTDDEARYLLGLAKDAARTSGDRKNAPLVTYLVGLARGRGDTRSIRDIAREISGNVDVR